MQREFVHGGGRIAVAGRTRRRTFVLDFRSGRPAAVRLRGIRGVIRVNRRRWIVAVLALICSGEGDAEVASKCPYVWHG
ncbi:MAG: hypothetical protein ABSG53_12510 [Thermoguttaceae bacterium]